MRKIMCNPWITVKIVHCLRYIEDTTRAFILLHLKFVRKGMQVYVLNVYSIWNACGCLRLDVWVCVSVCRCIRRAFQLVQCISTHLYSRIRTKIDIYVLMKNLPASTITIRVIFVFYTCIFQFILKFQEKLFIKMN